MNSPNRFLLIRRLLLILGFTGLLLIALLASQPSVADDVIPRSWLPVIVNGATPAPTATATPTATWQPPPSPDPFGGEWWKPYSAGMLRPALPTSSATVLPIGWRGTGRRG